METPVAYQCASLAHREAEGGPDKLTVHDGQWAFCPYDARADGHEWTPTGGLTLPMLRHAVALRHQGRRDRSGVR